MSGFTVSMSFVTTLLLSIFLSLGVTSLMYWVHERALSPLIIAHRKGIIRSAGLVYLAVLYQLQNLQFAIDPLMRVFGWHWAFLNLMLISLYVIVVQIGDWVTVVLQALCCAVYLLVYAKPLGPAVVVAFFVWVAVLVCLLLTRKQLQAHRLLDYLGIGVLGLAGTIGIYVSRPRIFDPWWWVRDLSAYLILGIIMSEYNRFTKATDAQAAALQRAAAYEQLTSQPVFTHDQATLTKMLTEATRQHQPLTLAALDVDHFSEVNQHYGYLAGNLALAAITDRLQRQLKGIASHARLFRSGGEEFTIALLNTPMAEATRIITACLDAMRTQPVTVNGERVAITLSAGLTLARPTDQTIADVYMRADDRLHASKKYGRAQLSADTDDPTRTTTPRLAYFAQPIEHVVGVGVQQWGAELLLREYDAASKRWRLPASFDLHVEQQITMMTEVMQHSALRYMTINLTLAQFSDTNTANALAGFAGAEYGPAGLIVEIVTVPDLSTIRRVTAVYRDAGIRVFIDDVGSDNSYELVSSILPYIDGIKFAMQNLRKHESLARIRQRVSFWATVAKHQPNLELILEGVEDEADIAFARSLGITYFQGYYYGKPSLLSA